MSLFSSCALSSLTIPRDNVLSSQQKPPDILFGCSIISNSRLGILQVLDIMLSSLNADDDYKDTSANSLVSSQHLVEGFS